MHPLTELLLKWGAFGTSLQELWIVGSIPPDISKMLTYSLEIAVFTAVFWIYESLEQAIGFSLSMYWFKYTHAEQRERHGRAIFISILTDLKWRVPVSICGTCYCSVGKSLSETLGWLSATWTVWFIIDLFTPALAEDNLIFYASNKYNSKWINLHAETWDPVLFPSE